MIMKYTTMIIFERNSTLEKNIGLEIENLSIEIEAQEFGDDKYTIYGEYEFENNDNYSEIHFEAIFYDDENKIINTNYQMEDLNGFLGY